MDRHLKKLQRERTRQATVGLLLIIGALVLFIILLCVNRGGGTPGF